MRKKLLILLILTIVASFTLNLGAFSYADSTHVSSFPANIYVDSRGSDYNDGATPEHPFATIQKAADATVPGSTVHVAPGIYTDVVRTSTSGTANAGIKYVSDVKWGAKIQISEDNVPWWNIADYITIQGFEITGKSTIGIQEGGSYVSIDGNHIYGMALDSSQCTVNGGAGIETYTDGYTMHDVDIIGNVIHDIGPNTDCNFIHGIYISGDRMRVLNNIISNIAGFGIHAWHAANNGVIANNLSFANRKGGIILGAGDAPGGVVADHFIVTNNIVVRNKGNGISEAGDTGNHNRYQSNLVYGNKENSFLLQNGSADLNTLNDVPVFVNYKADGRGDYHLKASSPGINAGTKLGAPSTDFDGNLRPQAKNNDVGPYEYVSPWLSKQGYTGVHDLGNGNTGKQVVEFDVTPLYNDISGMIGYSQNVTNNTSLSIIFGLSKAGYFNVRNGSVYDKLATVNYVANKKYHVKLLIDLKAKLYDVYVTTPSGKETLIAKKFKFRTDAPAIRDIKEVVLHNSDSDATNNEFKVENHKISKKYELANVVPIATPTPGPGNENIWLSKYSYPSFNLGTGNMGKVTTEFDLTTTFDIINGLVGYADSSTQIVDYSSLSMIIRTNPAGYFDVRNGDGYDKLQTVNYGANKKFHVKTVADITAKTYDVFITPENGNKIMVAKDYKFRTDAPVMDDLGKISLQSLFRDGQIKVENHTVKTTPTN